MRQLDLLAKDAPHMNAVDRRVLNATRELAREGRGTTMRAIGVRAALETAVVRRSLRRLKAGGHL